MPFFSKLDVRSWRVKPGTLTAYLLAAVLVGTATAARVPLGSDALHGQIISLFPAVIATTFICGTAAGFFSVALSAVCAWIIMLPPIFSPHLEKIEEIYVLIFFAAIASALVVITGALRSAISQVRRLNQMFARVFEENPDAILLTDLRGRIVNANQRAVVMFGQPSDALIGASIASLLPERFRGRHASLHPSYMADPHPRAMAAGTDVFALRADGTEFPVNIEIGPIQIDNESLAITTVRDITEHKALFEALAESRQRQAVLEERQAGTRALRTALESTTDSVVVLDRDWRFIYLNERAKAQNAQGRDLVGRIVWDVFPWLHESPVGHAWRTAMDTGAVTHADDRFAPLNAHFEAHAYPSADGLTVFLRDVTEERENAAARAATEAELETARARAVQAERVQALGQLAGGIAHDFNNVLQMIEGAATLIERRPGDETGVARLARLAMAATDRGASVTRRLLAFGRRGDLRAEALDMRAVFNGLQEIFVRTLGAAIDVHIELEAGLPPPFADKAQLEIVLVNLATNARDAMPDGGQLTMSAAAEVVAPDTAPHQAGLTPGRYVRLTVADTGIGMDKSTLARAQEPFFTTKELGAGTGLGLPMARGFAEQSGGALSVDSSPGRGTTVTLWLPEDRSDRSPRAPASHDAAAAASSGTPDATRSVRLLVVDDDDPLREVLAQNLDERGYDVTAAASGPEALALLGTDRGVDALITDLSMPGMDGIALIRAAQQRRPGLPAVLLTGYAGDESALEMGGAITGSFSLARKPITTNDLVDRIEALLAAHSSSSAAKHRERVN